MLQPKTKNEKRGQSREKGTKSVPNEIPQKFQKKKAPLREMKALLVIECQSTIDWAQIFAGSTLFGEEVRVIQAEFPDIVVTSYPDCGVVVDVRNKGTFTIDFVLLRSVTRSLSSSSLLSLFLPLLSLSLFLLIFLAFYVLTFFSPSLSHFLSLFLSFCLRCKYGQDSRNLLFGLMHGNVPSVNTLASAYMCLERPGIAQNSSIQASSSLSIYN